MKKYFAIGIIVLLFVLFAIFTVYRQKYTPVLNLINPATVQVDLNNNGKIDDGETVCIPETEAFSLYDKEKAPAFAKEFKLTTREIITLGYMADNYANSILLSKPVKVKFTGKITPECKYGDVYINNKNYSKLLQESGFASLKGEFIKEKFLEKLKFTAKNKLVIYNIKSGKYHNTDCKYGLMSSDYSIIPESQLPKNAKPCKYCRIHPEKSTIKNNIKPPDSTAASGSIRLILSDFTQKLKPDKNCDTQGCTALCDEINKAQNSIDLAVYGMNIVPAVYEALYNARNRGVVIRMVYDKSSSDKDYYTETEQFLKLTHQYKSDFIADKPGYTNKLMHNKFVIFDNETVFTGSMNLSYSGLSGYNSDAVVIINSKDIAKLYTAEFEQMLSGKFHELKTKPDLPYNFNLNGSKISVYFSPYDKTSEKIIPIIDGAKSYIYVPAYLITHEKIASALIRAKNRNVDVKIIIDANSTTTRNTKYLVLRENKIPVKTENYAGKLHSKSMIIDDKYIILGSMNFSNSGENKNDENTLVIENSELAKSYRKFFTYLWAKIPDIYLTRNARAEGKDTIGSCTDGIDNDFDGLTDFEDSACK